MAKILSSDLAGLYELGRAAKTSVPNTIYRLYFDPAQGKMYIVDSDFNILRTTTGVADGVTVVDPADLCAIGDFGLNAKASTPNAIYRLYAFQRPFDEEEAGLFLVDQNFVVLYYFEMAVEVAPLATVKSSDICVIQDFGLNADPAAENATWNLYLITAGAKISIALVNSAFEIVAARQVT